MYTFEFASGYLQVSGYRSTCCHHVCIKSLREFGGFYGCVVFEGDAFSFQNLQTAVDDGLIQFEVWNTIAEQSAGSFILFEYSDGISFVVQVVGGSKSCRTCTDDSHLLAITLRHFHTYEVLMECHLGDGCFVLAVGGGLVVNKIQHTGLFTESRTDTTGKLREGVGGVEQAVSQLIVAFVEGVVPLRWFVAQWTSPVAERYTAVHTAAGLGTAVFTIQCLFHFAEIVDSIVYWSITGFLTVYSQKCFWISHFLLYFNV